MLLLGEIWVDTYTQWLQFKIWIYLLDKHRWAVLRWWRNKTERPFSPPRIHWKIIWMLSKFHKTTSERRRGHQATRKAAHSLWKEVGKNIKDEKRDKRVRDGDPSWGGSHEGGEVSKHQEILSPVGLWGVWNLGGQHNLKEEREKKKKNTTDYAPSHDSQWRGSPDPHVCQKQPGAEQGGEGCMHGVGTGHECPEDNLKELTWESNPNCGISREKKEKERETERSCIKLWGIAWPTHRKKDWVNTRGELASCRLAPHPAGGIEAVEQQPEQED